MCKVVYEIKLIFSPAPPHILLKHPPDFQLNFPTIVSYSLKIGRIGYFLVATALQYACVFLIGADIGSM